MNAVEHDRERARAFAADVERAQAHGRIDRRWEPRDEIVLARATNHPDERHVSLGRVTPQGVEVVVTGLGRQADRVIDTARAIDSLEFTVGPVAR